MRQQLLSRGVVDDTTLTRRDVRTIPVADHHSGNLEERIGLALRDLVRADGIDQKEEDLDAPPDGRAVVSGGDRLVEDLRIVLIIAGSSTSGRTSTN